MIFTKEIRQLEKAEVIRGTWIARGSLILDATPVHYLDGTLLNYVDVEPLLDWKACDDESDEE